MDFKDNVNRGLIAFKGVLGGFSLPKFERAVEKYGFLKVSDMPRYTQYRDRRVWSVTDFTLTLQLRFFRSSIISMPLFGVNERGSPAITSVASFKPEEVLAFLESHGRLVVAAGGKREETASVMGLYLYAWKLSNSRDFIVRPFEDYANLVNLVHGNYEILYDCIYYNVSIEELNAYLEVAESVPFDLFMAAFNKVDNF